MLARRILLAFICAGLGLIVHSASAALVNWDVLTWTPGALSNSYDVDPTNPGSDVTFVITGTKTDFQPDKATHVLTPAITQSLQGGVSPLQKSLQLSADLGTNSAIKLTINFSSQYTLGVTNVMFPIFDIDLETNKDQLSNIFGTALDGTKVAPTVTYGSAITATGGGVGLKLTGTGASPDTGAGSAAGTAWLSFGSTPIKSLTFTWTNTNGAPFYQQIAIGDILFSAVVPETNAATPALIICVFAALFGRPSKRNGARR